MGATLPFGVTATRASSGTRVNSSKLIVLEATDVPRFTYDPVTGALEGFLNEPPRTNIVGYSQDLTGQWTINQTVNSVAAGITAPDGTTANVTKVTENSAGPGIHETYRTMGHSSGVAYAAQAILKAGLRTWATVNYYDGVVAFGAYFDLANGVIGSDFSGSGTILSKRIKPLGNGWYLCEIVALSTSTGGNVFVGLATGDGGKVYTGDGTSYIYHWNTNHEAGTIGSSVIFTNAGASVTRAGDILTLPLSNGRYVIDAYRLSGRTRTIGVSVSGGAGYVVTNDVSPLQKVVAWRA